MNFFSIEFWVGFQMVVLIGVVFLMAFYIRRLKTSIRKEVSHQAMEEILEMMSPLLKEAGDTARVFDDQIREKNKLISKLNGTLDSKIISLNLLLNRSEVYLQSLSDTPKANNHHVYDQQQSILDMFEEGLEPDMIAKKLSMPKGEVDLVINLKKKFLSMD